VIVGGRVRFAAAGRALHTTVFSGSTPLGNGLTGGVGGLWGTPAALVMNGAVTLCAEVVAGVAVLRGFGRIGGGHGVGSAKPGPVAANTGVSLRSID
jgi:hypothetical protein